MSVNRSLGLVAKFLAILSVICLLCPWAQGDLIYLKNGNKLQGQIISDDGKWVKIRVPKGVLFVKKKEILRVEKEKDGAYRLGKAKHLRSLMALEDALDQIKRALVKKPNSLEVKREIKKIYLAIVQQAMDRKQLYKAWSRVGEVAKMFPQDPKIQGEKQRVQKIYLTILQLSLKADELYGNHKYQQAMDLYLKVVEHLPNQINKLARPLSTCYFKVGARKLRAKKNLEAFSLFKKALNFFPDFAPFVEPYLVYAILGETSRLYKEKKWDRGIKTVQEGIYYAPNNRKLHFFLAHGYFSKGLIEKSIQEYFAVLDRSVPRGKINLPALQRAAAKMAKIKLVSSKEEDQMARGVLPGKWRKISTSHFVIYHRNFHVGNRVATLAEHYFQVVEKQFASSVGAFAKPCEIYLYPTKLAYQRASGLPSWNPGVTQHRTRGGSLIYHRILTYQTAISLYQSILPHEIGHIMTLKAVGYGRIPRWISEGMAVGMEYSYKKNYYKWQVKASMANKTLIPLKKLLQINKYPANELENRIFYAHSYTLVDFLQKRDGWPKVLDLAKALGYESPAKAFSDIYGFSSLKEVERSWRAYLEE